MQRYGAADSFTIVGVYRDFPHNSSVDKEMLVNLGNYSISNTSTWAFYCYISTTMPQQALPVLDAYMESFGNGGRDVRVRLTGLHDAYYTRDVSPDNIAKGNRQTTATLFFISLLILLIAAINFVNFSMASVPFRIKGLNTRRVVGATRGELVLRQLGTALVFVLLAFVLGTGMMSLAATSSLASYISGPLRVQDNPDVLLIGLGAAVVTALAAGIPCRDSHPSEPAGCVAQPCGLDIQGVRRNERGFYPKSVIIRKWSTLPGSESK